MAREAREALPTSRLKPSTTASATIITATLVATETTAMRSITPGLSPGAGCSVRRAMKRAVSTSF